MLLDGDYIIPYLRVCLLSGFRDSSCRGFTYSSVSIVNDLLASTLSQTVVSIDQ